MIGKVSSLLAGVLMLVGFLVHAETSDAGQADATKPESRAIVAAASRFVVASPSAFAADLDKHWTTAKGLAVAVAEAMPAVDYAFKPMPEEMSFGEQIMHIAQANFGYCAFLTDAKSPFVEMAKDAKVDKAEAVKQLTGSFDYCSAAFSKVTDAELDTVHGTGDHKFVARDVMLGVMIHMVHHRGQAEVYLRLKGIKPPDYKW
jgi:uncharacterized damage-inducible protein DinB